MGTVVGADAVWFVLLALASSLSLPLTRGLTPLPLVSRLEKTVATSDARASCPGAACKSVLLAGQHMATCTGLAVVSATFVSASRHAVPGTGAGGVVIVTPSGVPVIAAASSRAAGCDPAELFSVTSSTMRWGLARCMYRRCSAQAAPPACTSCVSARAYSKSSASAAAAHAGAPDELFCAAWRTEARRRRGEKKGREKKEEEEEGGEEEGEEVEVEDEEI